MDIDELLTHIKKLKVDLNFGKKETYSSPSRVFLFFHVLSDEPLSLDNTMRHWFNPLTTRQLSAVYKDVIHGHFSAEVCAAPHFCHVYGYQPKSTDNPNFRRVFFEKWKDLYNDKG